MVSEGHPQEGLEQSRQTRSAVTSSDVNVHCSHKFGQVLRPLGSAWRPSSMAPKKIKLAPVPEGPAEPVAKKKPGPRVSNKAQSNKLL